MPSLKKFGGEASGTEASPPATNESGDGSSVQLRDADGKLGNQAVANLTSGKRDQQHSHRGQHDQGAADDMTIAAVLAQHVSIRIEFPHGAFSHSADRSEIVH